MFWILMFWRTIKISCMLWLLFRIGIFLFNLIDWLRRETKPHFYIHFNPKLQANTRQSVLLVRTRLHECINLLSVDSSFDSEKYKPSLVISKAFNQHEIRIIVIFQAWTQFKRINALILIRIEFHDRSIRMPLNGSDWNAFSSQWLARNYLWMMFWNKMR